MSSRSWRIRHCVSIWALRSILLSLGLGWIAAQSQAAELYESVRGARIEAMGGAYIALSDDEQAVWRNPAGLAGNRSSGLHIAIADISVSPDILGVYTDAMGALNNPSLASLNTLLGKDVFVRGQATPTLIMGNLGASILFDQQFSFKGENQALPEMEFGYQTTNGVQLAYGLELAKGNKTKRTTIKVGAAAKMLFRRGGYRKLPTSALLNPSTETLLSRIGNFGKGYGGDLGVHVSHSLMKGLKLQGALVATDLGDTSFGNGPDPIRMNVAAGMGFVYELKRAGQVSLLYELRHLNEAADIRRKTHLGMEVALPVVKFFGGYNQAAFLSYGAAVDLAIFRLTASYTSEEMGPLVYQDPQSRYQLRVDVRLGM